MNIDNIKAQSITVYSDSVTGEISPLLYGTGFENFGNEIHLGLWADMIDGKSMEGDSDGDGVADKWNPTGEGNNIIVYEHDPVNPLNTEYSQKIQITSYTSGYRGIAQGGLYLATGKTYALSLFLRQNGLEGGVTVSLTGEYGVYAQVVFDSISQEWAKYSATLTSSATVDDAQLQITFAEDGILWVDQVVLMPEDNYRGHGTRRDIMEKLVRTRPTCIRWPGGFIAEQYDWRDGIGDPDYRPTTLVYASDVRNQWYPELVPNQFGTDEFMQFLEDIGGAEPILTVNSGYAIDGPLPQEYITNAVNWVEYCNGDTTTPFGALRAANGHPEPYNVKYWNIGNEPWQMTATDYANRFVRFAIAMKAKDPSIRLIAEDAPWSYWLPDLLQIAGQYIDFISEHRYYMDRYVNSMSYPNYIERQFNDIKNIIDFYVPDNNILISFNEWNNNTPQSGGNALGWTLKEGLFTAGMFNALERQSDIVFQSGLWPLFRGEAAYDNIPYARHNLIHYDNHRLATSVTYLTLDLYRANFAPNRLAVDVVSDDFHTNLASNVSYLDAVATKNETDDRLILKVVNKDSVNDMKTTVAFMGYPEPTIDSIASVYRINSSNTTDMNTLNNPNVVAIDSFTISYASANFQFTFPAHSITVMKLSGSFPSAQTAITENDNNISLPTQLTLYQNYPNPFNIKTVIQYNLPTSGKIILEVYDLAGRSVRTLVNKTQPAGKQRVIWNGKNNNGASVPSGLYFTRLTYGNATKIKKMILVK
ncbi:MAG: T9SS type A sorting domain-containing protein [FCB group bacterium]|nr:T9SS type A sorting domain-containing protein [FCB group bacterium]